MRSADGRTYSEHSRSPSYSRIELGLRTKYCAFWSGRTGGAMVEIYSLSRFVTVIISLLLGSLVLCKGLLDVVELHD